MTAEKIKSNSREKINRKIEHYSYSVSFFTHGNITVNTIRLKNLAKTGFKNPFSRTLWITYVDCVNHTQMVGTHTTTELNAFSVEDYFIRRYNKFVTGKSGRANNKSILFFHMATTWSF